REWIQALLDKTIVYRQKWRERNVERERWEGRRDEPPCLESTLSSKKYGERSLCFNNQQQ
ncbi:hypothetical protein J6590_040414, partial [Homalodisca vitripennis]